MKNQSKYVTWYVKECSKNKHEWKVILLSSFIDHESRILNAKMFISDSKRRLFGYPNLLFRKFLKEFFLPSIFHKMNENVCRIMSQSSKVSKMG